MGIDVTVYVGPYAECRNEMVPVEEHVPACGNPDCESFGRAVHHAVTYCGLCGGRIGPFPRQVMVPRISWGDVDEIVGHDLTCLNAHEPDSGADLWGINRAAWRERPLMIDPRAESLVMPVNTSRMVMEVRAFGDDYAMPIDRLIDLYGPGNVKILWGVVCSRS